MTNIYQEIAPSVVTGIARKALADEDRLRNQFLFGRWFERELTPTINYEFDLGTDRDFSESARFRTFDAPPRLGTRPGVMTVRGSLPPIGIEYLVREYDKMQLQAASGNATVAELLLPVVAKDAIRGINAVERRFEFVRRDLLLAGKAQLVERGIQLDIDVERDPAREMTVGTDWDNGGTPITDERYVLDVMRDEEDMGPGDMVEVMNTKTWRDWKNSAEVRNLLQTYRVVPSLTDSAARQLRRDEELPDVIIHDAQANNPRTGVKEKFVPDDVVLFLPNFVIGRTQYGIPSMAGEPDVGLLFNQQPGPLGYVDRNLKPLNYSTVIDALGVPLLKDPDATYTMTTKN